MAVNFLVNFNFPNTIKCNKANPNPCPDQLVGSFLGTTFTLNNTRQNIEYINNNRISNPLTEPIVIILESPHKNEYNPITSLALGPAMGTTGNNLKKYFASIIQNSKIYPLIDSAPHDVVLVNAIQYQCSLGQPLNSINAELRNKNFIKCFQGGSKTNDLQRRLTALNPFATINLCTKALQPLVTNIANNFKNYTDGNHPSSWWNPRYRLIN